MPSQLFSIVRIQTHDTVIFHCVIRFLRSYPTCRVFTFTTHLSYSSCGFRVYISHSLSPSLAFNSVTFRCVILFHVVVTYARAPYLVHPSTNNLGTTRMRLFVTLVTRACFGVLVHFRTSGTLSRLFASPCPEFFQHLLYYLVRCFELFNNVRMRHKKRMIYLRHKKRMIYLCHKKHTIYLRHKKRM